MTKLVEKIYWIGMGIMINAFIISWVSILFISDCGDILLGSIIVTPIAMICWYTFCCVLTMIDNYINDYLK